MHSTGSNMGYRDLSFPSFGPLQWRSVTRASMNYSMVHSSPKVQLLKHKPECAPT